MQALNPGNEKSTGDPIEPVPNAGMDAERMEVQGQCADAQADPVGPVSRSVTPRRPPGIQIPTKSEDGGSRSPKAAAERGTRDSFLKYSDDDTRMAELLGLNDDVDGEEAANVNWREIVGIQDRGHIQRARDGAADQEGQDGAGGDQVDQDGANGNPQEQNPPRRNTRISFELHNSVFRDMV
mmetsp:Transcript_14365/g.31127  ORF Transcript_14365/g.31127 Transcript_14365/m.31127 type:complete len:182 (-) Transcript_14365:281-826(-)|eukprot:CAMPEP_0172331830 /NCGR_PEP_ID=MMETSP1058-20130122/62127_1 /TAXON_ID=83371 /ORGANISM="Detonula confervacea, Strain CCMP 353" /LENGTH=181 /DNA_ID=CAMNT_0013049103 /DNA_START=94 /DNA_END=639 /DNA_ORIENTATION=+